MLQELALGEVEWTLDQVELIPEEHKSTSIHLIVQWLIFQNIFNKQKNLNS